MLKDSEHEQLREDLTFVFSMYSDFDFRHKHIYVKDMEIGRKKSEILVAHFDNN